MIFSSAFSVASRRLGRDPAEAVGDAVHMRIDAQRGFTEGVDQNAVGGLASDAGQSKKCLYGVGDLAVVTLNKNGRQGKEARGFFFAVLAAAEQIVQRGFLGSSQRGGVGIRGKDAGRRPPWSVLRGCAAR